MNRSFIADAPPAVVIEDGKKVIIDNDVATFGDYQFSDKLQDIKDGYDSRRSVGKVAWSNNKKPAQVS